MIAVRYADGALDVVTDEAKSKQWYQFDCQRYRTRS